jgi:hypothetical protein
MKSTRPSSFFFPLDHALRGFLLLEMAVLLLVTVPLILGLAHTIGVATALRAEVAAFAEGVTVYARTHATVARAVSNLDTHRFPFGLTVHPPGSLTFTDGTPHPLTTMVSPESTPLSSLELATAATLILGPATPTGGRDATAVWGERIPPDTRLFLGIATGGFTLLRGSARHLSASPRRYELILEPVRSVTVPTTPLDIAALRLCIPVKREYSLLIDRTGQLRYIGQNGTGTSENQPLLRGVKDITIESSPPGEGIPLGYRVTIITRDGRSREATAIPTTSRLDPDYFTLVRP